MIYFFTAFTLSATAFGSALTENDKRFIFFWTFQIAWLSVTFQSVPWPMLGNCSRSIVKTMYYLRYCPTFWPIECILVFIFHCVYLWLTCYYLQFFIFLSLYSQKVYGFPWLSMTHTSISINSRPGKWNFKIPWLFRCSMTLTNSVISTFSIQCKKWMFQSG